jgi:heme-degrading monooxygenase HmoA
MYNRVVTLSGVKDIDGLLASMKETSVSALRAQRGYKGFSVSADRASGLVGTMTVWETEADRDASDSALAKLREEITGRFATDIKVDTFEERVVEVSKPPTVGSRLMVTRVSMDPAKVDEIIEAFRQEVVPQIKAAPGFRTLRNMINPQTGEGIAGTVWDDEKSMQAAAEMAMARRPEGEARGVKFGETSYREIIFVDSLE